MTLNLLQTWPEPITRVQTLSDSGLTIIPDRYIKPPSQRPIITTSPKLDHVHIPVIDLSGLFSDDNNRHLKTLELISTACREWGFFQAINHGVPIELLRLTRQIWRGFFHLSVEEKNIYANSPATYEGYGSRIGIEKGAKLDWSDYFFLHYLPEKIRDVNKWPSLPMSCREVTSDYGKEMVKLCERIMKGLSLILGLQENYLQNAFGGKDCGACMRANYYPKCPQPDLTLGLSSHSDPGGLTLLLPDDNVVGLQVRRNDLWITIDPVLDAIIVNLGDQIQVMSNGIFKSVEHRVIVNSERERVSIACFYNPRGEIYVEPAKELLSEDRPALYPGMTFNEYRLFIRLNGPCGKSQVESLRSPK
ncbi:jasmonate-induced oxygenase 1-like [Impatiens glandulifera]|uniref:jasmonate-induced oxygenase 1-like n=1 Tax=Impatiens glandulifera TaxID=253017 RepID=UPI001FB06063|nr:jasmonate-induced oxygenase 1-like [Impatiens glandulifera]